MLQYPIHLTTVQQFKKYASFTYKFPVTGYVRTQNKEINLSFLHELMCHCPIRQADLVLTSCRTEDVPAIESWLLTSGLLDLGRSCAAGTDKSA